MLKIIFLLTFIVNLPIIIFFKKIIKLIGVYDKVDNIRKFHKTDIALFGGILIFINLIFLIIFDLVLDLNLFNESTSTREYFSFCFGITLFFFLGFYDDKFNLSANKKLFLNFLIILFLILLDDTLVIRQLNFTFIENPVDLRNFSHLFTILCILLFINALNMFDGINLQAGTFSLIIFVIFLSKDIFILLNTILIISLIVFLVFNFQNKMFLGDSGTHLLAFVISYMIIKSYNIKQSFSPEEIFVILSLPGLDMFRLFLHRIIKNKNPFKSDRNHIHHLILKKLSPINTFLLIQLFVIINVSIFYNFQNKLNILFLNLFLYIVLFLFFFQGRKKN